MSSPSKRKSPKRAQNQSAGSFKQRKQNENHTNVSAFPQKTELQDDSLEGVSSMHSQERMDIDIDNYSHTSSEERIYSETDTSEVPAQNLVDLQKSFAENALLINVDFSNKASEEEAGLARVLKAETALRNTCGGVIILNVKNKSDFGQRDKWFSKLEDLRDKKLSKVKNPETFDEILDCKEEGFSSIFVRKSSIVLTEESKCLLQRFETRNQGVTSYSETCSILNKKRTACCCESEQKKIGFIFGKKMPFPESKTVEYKYLTGRDFPTSLRKELREYIAAFANTAGGTIYFGIKDEDASILGQKINNEIERNRICHNIEECMSSKRWIQDSGERVSPVKNSNYDYEFIPVQEAGGTIFVIRIHICKFAGTVFMYEPVAFVLNEDNEIVKMDFEKWWALHKSCITGNRSAYLERFEERRRGTSIFYSVKETVEKFVWDLTFASPGHLKLHPSHATKWINHPALDMLVNKTGKLFKEYALESGIAYIERCWEVNLGLPSTKPDDVICDVLICCPKLPLVFVSLTKSDTPDETSCSYNKKVAWRIKAALVQEAHCLEKFYVKPVVTSLQQLVKSESVSSIYSESRLYPKPYCMNTEKFSKILEALVLVLARANVMSSHIIGQGLFNLLTYDQYKILHEFYADSEKVKITGPPGSGKTVLALERILRLREGGCTFDQVLFLCSYKPLKARIESMKMRHDKQPLCIVMTYYELAPLVASDENCHLHLNNFKHILADEVQNFEAEPNKVTSLDWWYKLVKMWDDKEDSSFWVFFDISQRINTKRSVSLRGFSQKKLNTIIRTTGEIYKFICGHKYMAIDSDVSLGHNFMGKNVEVMVPSPDCVAGKEEHLLSILIDLLHRLVDVDGYDKNRITVLFTSLGKRDNFQANFLGKANGCLIKNGEEVSKEGVVFETTRRYSGEENDIVIGFCPEFYPSGQQNNKALMVSLCSRAKLELFLILEDEEMASRFKLSNFRYVECKNVSQNL